MWLLKASPVVALYAHQPIGNAHLASSHTYTLECVGLLVGYKKLVLAKNDGKRRTHHENRTLNAERAETAKESRWILVLTNCFPKWQDVLPKPDATAPILSTTLDERVVCYPELPEQMCTDQEPTLSLS